MGTGLYKKDIVMDIVVTSALHKSCLFQTSKSSDYAIRKAENEKYKKDSRSVGPIHNNSTKRFVPPAMNHLGLRGGHFNASLKSFATTLVTKPRGCSLMKGSFALSMNGALRKIMNTWGGKTGMDSSTATRGSCTDHHGVLLLMRVLPQF
jgi:hypothetical protein